MYRLLPFALLAIAITDSVVLAQSRGPRQAPASSRRINGRDGDVVVINGDDRVTIVRRHQGNIRTVFDPQKHALLLLADFSSPSGNTPDGLVDATYTFTEVNGDWPLGARWEGPATVDEYSTATNGRRSVVITTPAGALELKPPAPDDFVYLEGASPAPVFHRGSGMRVGPGKPFDEAERIANDQADRPQFGISGGITTSTGGVVTAVSPPPSRAGHPAKLFDVKPTYPPAARRAGIAGSVILQITVSTDGTVADARILRGIPELNDAALEAVRQWRYDMTTASGPITLTVTVPFGT